MSDSKAQNQPNTNNSDVPTLEQIEAYWKKMGWEIHPNAIKEIRRWAAQEANKARIDEHNLTLRHYHPDNDSAKFESFLSNRYIQLKAEKGTSNE